MFRRNKKKAETENKKFILSDDAVYFIKNFAMKELNIALPIDEDKFDAMYNFACDCELNMIDVNGDDIQEDYPGKERDIFGDKLVSEYSGKDCEPDLDDLNARLG